MTDQLRILLIEDDDVDAESIRRTLRRADNVEIVCVRELSLAAGLERLKRETFDLMFLDLGLPDRSGRETLIYARAGAPRIPIVVLTGADAELSLWALQHGAQDYLLKEDISKDSLLRAARFATERSKMVARIEEYAARTLASEAALHEKIATLEEGLARLQAALRFVTGPTAEDARLEAGRLVEVIAGLEKLRIQ